MRPGNEAKLKPRSLGARLSSGGSRFLKRGVSVCDLSTHRAPARGGLEACPPGNFGFLTF